MGDDGCIDMDWVQAVAQFVDSGGDFVEMDDFLAPVTLDYVHDSRVMLWFKFESQICTSNFKFQKIDLGISRGKVRRQR